MVMDSDVEFDDDEIDHKKHDKIIEDILSLNKKQNIKKPSRTEPASEVSEFSLVKPTFAKKGSVHLNELTKVLGNRKKQLDISRVIKTSNKKKPLPVPLHKPQAEQIRRSLNYEKSRFQLDKWEALVTANRVANLSFPLDSVEKLKIVEKEAERYPSTWRMKSDLQKKLEQLQPPLMKSVPIEESENFELTLKELQEKRKEAAKLRAFQSYKESKMRRQSKIKSKKYHRMLKREKIKEKLKEFEELQKSNPEEAMRKLEDIEKARAEERFSLRHKGTGQWAKSKQVRAKYDKETRQVLAKQLAISRELTQKVKPTDSDSGEEGMEAEEIVISTNDSGNPWVNGIKPEKEVNDFISGFRKYWQTHNENIVNGETVITDSKSNEEKVHVKNPTKEAKKKNKTKNKPKLKGVQIKDKVNSSPSNSTASTLDWEVSFVNDGTEGKIDQDVEQIFNTLEDKVTTKIKNKFNKIEKLALTKKDKKTLNKKSKAKSKKIDLTMKPSSQKQIIDEELFETASGIEESRGQNAAGSFKNIMGNLSVEGKESNVDINPEKFIKAKNTILHNAIPDLTITDENEEESEQQKGLILEAFEDDDIAEDFQKEKEKAIDEDTPKDIDLTLPGWGSWAGHGIKPTKKKTKRLILKMPPVQPRKDQNKGSLIINKKAESKIKSLLVSEVPFPFKTVKDYEASIRAPIGNTFVPERAFKKLIEPNVTTKMGAIIEPIRKSMLMGKKSV